MPTINKTFLFPSADSIGNAISETGDWLGNTSGALSIVRQPLQLINVVTEGGSVAALSGVFSGHPLLVTEAIGGGMLAVSGLILTGKQLLQIYKDWKRQSYRSLALRTLIYLPTALTTAAIGFALTIQKAATLSGAMSLAQGAGSAVTFLAPVQSAFHLISASYNIYTAEQLSDSLNEHQKSPPTSKQPSQKKFSRRAASEKRQRQIKYLKESITRDPEKFARKTSQECLKKVQDFFDSGDTFSPQDAKEELNTLFNEVQIARKRANMIGKIRESVKKSPNEFARQTSKSCLREARQFFQSEDRFLEENQKTFLHTVYKENYQAKIRSRMLLIVALIGLTACLIAIFASGGAALPLISLLSGLLWMMANSKHLTDKICNWFWRQNQFDILPKELQEADPSQKKGELEFALKTTGLILTAPVWLVPAFIFYETKSLCHRISDILQTIRFTYVTTSFENKDEVGPFDEEIKTARTVFAYDRERKLCRVFVKSREILTAEDLEKLIEEYKIEDDLIKHLVFDLSTQKGQLQMQRVLLENSFLKDPELDEHEDIIKCEHISAKEKTPFEVIHDFKKQKTTLKGILVKVQKDGNGKVIKKTPYLMTMEVDWATRKSQLLAREAIS